MKGILMAVPKVSLEMAEVFEVPAVHSHVTLEFGADKDEVKNLIGREFEAEVIGNAYDYDVQALMVSLPQGIPCGNKQPHITISMNEGIKPFQSNEMLARKFGTTVEDINFKVPMKVVFQEWR